MTPIERAARALVKSQSGTDDWLGLDQELQDTIRTEVRAVLQAIRAPSDKMRSDGAYQLAEGSGLDASLVDMEAAWKAMIDAALDEG